ncbi:hypothetical protein M2146_001066 [Lachnospiraceae bacterium PF1-22]
MNSNPIIEYPFLRISGYRKEGGGKCAVKTNRSRYGIYGMIRAAYQDDKGCWHSVLLKGDSKILDKLNAFKEVNGKTTPLEVGDYVTVKGEQKFYEITEASVKEERAYIRITEIKPYEKNKKKPEAAPIDTPEEEPVLSREERDRYIDLDVEDLFISNDYVDSENFLDFSNLESEDEE